MRITLIGFGTRGDVTPLVALGERLRAGGHAVRLASHPEFESLARQHHVDFHAIPGSFQRFLATRAGRRALGVPRCTPLGLMGLFDPFRDCAKAVFDECWDACADAEAIGSSPLASIIVRSIAQAKELPVAVASPIPRVASRYLPSPAFPAWPLGTVYNGLTHFLTPPLVLRGARDIFDVWRREASRVAPGASNRAVREITLVAASPLVVPRQPDWPATAHVSGYWFVPRKGPGAVPEEVRAFFKAGPPPICFGFGSMADDNPEELRTIVLDVLARLKTRAVVVGGSGGALVGFGEPETVCEAPFVDYDWLFRNVPVVVHQGGAGTAAHCLTAGVPQVIVPYCLDHTFWAWRMREIGVAPPAIGRHRLTASALAKAIRLTIDNPSFRAKAAALAPRISAEDGLGQAARTLNDHFGCAAPVAEYAGAG